MVKMYVATHIDGPSPDLSYAERVQAGAANKAPWALLRDDIGDNISHKNSVYAEITVLYWIWKHTTDEKVGLCHYRRYFSPILFGQAHDIGAQLPLSAAQVTLNADAKGLLFDMELELAQMIVPVAATNKHSMADYYCLAERPSDWAAMLQALADVHPDEAEAAEAYFKATHAIHYWSMFITRRAILNEYCEWLFPLLFHLETLFVVPEEPAHMRVIGFLCERLLNYWVASRALQVVHRPILMIAPPVAVA